MSPRHRAGSGPAEPAIISPCSTNICHQSSSINGWPNTNKLTAGWNTRRRHTGKVNRGNHSIGRYQDFIDETSNRTMRGKRGWWRKKAHQHGSQLPVYDRRRKTVWYPLWICFIESKTSKKSRSQQRDKPRDMKMEGSHRCNRSKYIR